MHISFLGTWELPCRDSLDLQKSSHINAKVQVGLQGTSDSRGKKKSGGGSFQGRAHTWDPWAGWTLFCLITVADRCLGRCRSQGELGGPACSLTGASPLSTLPGGSWGKLSKWGKISWQTCRFQKEARTTILSSNVPNSLSPTLEPDHPEEQR